MDSDLCFELQTDGLEEFLLNFQKEQKLMLASCKLISEEVLVEDTEEDTSDSEEEEFDIASWVTRTVVPDTDEEEDGNTETEKTTEVTITIEPTDIISELMGMPPTSAEPMDESMDVISDMGSPSSPPSVAVETSQLLLELDCAASTASFTSHCISCRCLRHVLSELSGSASTPSLVTHCRSCTCLRRTVDRSTQT